MKNKSLVVATSFALLLAAWVPTARAEGTDQPWGPNFCPTDFIECFVQGLLNVL